MLHASALSPQSFLIGLSVLMLTFTSALAQNNCCGIFLSEWGSEGSGPGQFQYPEGVAVDGSGNVFVADTQNTRVQKFDNNGTFLTMWGSPGSGPGQFAYPAGVAVDGSGNVLVADAANDRIQTFDNNGGFLTVWGSQGSGPGELSGPIGIAVDLNGNVFVADSGNDRIQKFDSNGTFLTMWGSYGVDPGQFLNLTGVAVDGNGSVFVSDYTGRIQKFDSDGTFLTMWGTIGSGPGQFVTPLGVAVDGNGNVFVADSGNVRIQMFDNNGTFLRMWRTLGFASDPYGVAVDGSGSVFVIEQGNVQIQKFGCDGSDRFRELAEHWAPVIFQDTDETAAKADYITRFDFDGNWRGWDNYDHLDDYAASLPAYVYYWVVETDTHWFIGYAMFHPFDWAELDACLGDCHENDLEGVLAVIMKDGSNFGQFLLLHTVFHKKYPSYQDPDHDPSSGTMCTPTCGDLDCDEFYSSNVSFEFNNPRVYVESHGHGIRASLDWESSGFPGGDGIIYRYTGAAGVPPSPISGAVQVGYDLQDIQELWSRRCEPETFFKFGTFRGDDFKANAANAPWGWSGFLCQPDEGFFRFPADAIGDDFSGLGPFTTNYLCASFSPGPNDSVATNCGSGSEVIDSAGGTVTAPDGSVTVSVPPGALSGPTMVSVTGQSQSQYGVGSMTTNLVVLADLDAEGATFDPPAVVTFKWLDMDGNGLVDGTFMAESDLRVFRNGVPLSGTQRCGAQICTAQACCDQAANSWTLRVSEFSEYAIGLDSCVATTTAKLTVKKVVAPPGDDKLTFKGSFTLVDPVSSVLDPVLNGVALRLTDTSGVVLYVEIPGGGYDTATKTGWKLDGTGTKWTYVNRTATPPGGITKAILADKSANAPGLATFKFRGKNGSYGVSTAVDADVIFPGSWKCFEATFPAVPPATPSCLLSGTTLKCK